MRRYRLAGLGSLCECPQVRLFADTKIVVDPTLPDGTVLFRVAETA